MRRLVETTIAELSFSGLELLTPGTAYLFISNHRDIVLDSGILNYVIFHAGHQTARMAVGDNLLTERFAADLMRLNKSFQEPPSISLLGTSCRCAGVLMEGVPVARNDEPI